MNFFQYRMDTPIGQLYLLSNGTALCGLSLSAYKRGVLERKDDLLAKAIEEVEEYFTRRRRYFTCPLYVEGTLFQRETWGLLQNIPYGERRTYGDLAKGFSHPRAIGFALKKNPIPLFIPCHRVVGKRGLVGFGMGLEVKRFLLELEEEAN